MSAGNQARNGKLLLAAAVTLFLAALLIRLFAAQRQLIWSDELYHVIAGRSLNEGHGLQIYEGIYTRTPLFTWVISELVPFYHWNLLVPRLPAVLAGALQVAVMFAWLQRRIGWVAGLTAAAFYCLSEVAVQQAAYVRFYSIHALFFWLTATSAYDALYASSARRMAFAGVIAAASAAISFHLQPITIIGLAAIGAWGIWVLIFVRPSSAGIKRLVGYAAATLLLVVGALLLFPPPVVHRAIEAYMRSEQWNLEHRSDLLYYARFLLAQYPVITAGFILSAVLAWRRWAPLTMLCVAITAIALLALSFSGMKSPRYLLYALPFIFTVFGLGLSSAWPMLLKAMSGVPRRATWLGLSAFTLVAVLATDPGFATTITSSTGGLKRALKAHSPLFAAPGDGPWQARRSEIAQALAGKSVILTTDEFRAVLYFGAFDLAIVPGYNTGGGERDFGDDPRTGRPQISTVQNVADVYNCYPSGALLVFSQNWPAAVEVDSEVQNFLDSRTQHQTFADNGEGYSLHVLSWEHDEAAPSSACAIIRGRVEEGHVPARSAFQQVLAEPAHGRISLKR